MDFLRKLVCISRFPCAQSCIIIAQKPSPALQNYNRGHLCRKWRFVSTSTKVCVKNEGGQPQGAGPLTGIKVLDLTRILAGPYCTMIMGDLGADIIKVERPGAGDDTRTWGPPFCDGESAYFLAINRNKKSIAVNMQKPQGADLLRQLAGQCDVLIENYLPNKLNKFGLGYSHLKELFPHLIYCSISGYGQTGPLNQRPGYDVIVSGVAGLMHITGPEDGEPCKVGVAMTDLSTGLYAFGAIMAAMLHQNKTGRGQHIDCNLLSTQVASLVNIGSNYLNAGMEAKRHGTAHASIVPYQAFKTSNGYILAGAGNDVQFKELCSLIQLEGLREDSRFLNNSLRVANRNELLALISRRFSSKSTEDWLKILDGANIPYGALNNMEQVFAEPQVAHNGLIQEMEHPTAGTIRLPGPAVQYSETGTTLRWPPPTLGQHTDEVLQGMLQLSDNDLNTLREQKVIQ